MLRRPDSGYRGNRKSTNQPPPIRTHFRNPNRGTPSRLQRATRGLPVSHPDACSSYGEQRKTNDTCHPRPDRPTPCLDPTRFTCRSCSRNPLPPKSERRSVGLLTGAIPAIGPTCSNRNTRRQPVLSHPCGRSSGLSNRACLIEKSGRLNEAVTSVQRRSQPHRTHPDTRPECRRLPVAPHARQPIPEVVGSRSKKPFSLYSRG
jgi:hypothetical protein